MSLLDPVELIDMLSELTIEMSNMFSDGIFCQEKELGKFRGQMADVVNLIKDSYRRFTLFRVKTTLMSDLNRHAAEFAQAAICLDSKCSDEIFKLNMNFGIKSLFEQDDAVPDFAEAFGSAIRNARGEGGE